jgi:hypothetical protein
MSVAFEEKQNTNSSSDKHFRTAVRFISAQGTAFPPVSRTYVWTETEFMLDTAYILYYTIGYRHWAVATHFQNSLFFPSCIFLRFASSLLGYCVRMKPMVGLSCFPLVTEMRLLIFWYVPERPGRRLAEPAGQQIGFLSSASFFAWWRTQNPLSKRCDFMRL